MINSAITPISPLSHLHLTTFSIPRKGSGLLHNWDEEFKHLEIKCLSFRCLFKLRFYQTVFCCVRFLFIKIIPYFLNNHLNFCLKYFVFSSRPILLLVTSNPLHTCMKNFNTAIFAFVKVDLNNIKDQHLIWFNMIFCNEL